MAVDRHTRITVETERILMIARQHAAYGWCERCGLEVELLPSAQASHLLHLVEERLHGQQHGKLHLEQAKNGLVVCLKSLLRLLQAASGQHNSMRQKK